MSDPPNRVLLLSLIKDALYYGSQDEAITPVVVERGLAQLSPGVRLDCITLLSALPHDARTKLVTKALEDEPDGSLQDMLTACAKEIT